MSRRVVVTGMGIVTSLGQTVDEVWQRIANGESGIHEIKLFDTSDMRVKIGGDILDWDASDFIDPREIKRIDRFTQFAIVAADNAVKQANFDFDNEDATRFACILGSGIGGLTTIEEQITRLVLKGPNRVSPLTIPKLMLNAGSANIAIRYGLKGPNYSVATACASATNAMGDGFQLIRNGVSDVVVAGGLEAAMTRMGLAGFQNMRALSERKGDPAKASRPFDSYRDGFVFSEGAGMIVMEELERARARGATILAELIGFGTTCDAGHITQPEENGSGAAAAMRLALKNAGIQPGEMDYINAHGTSTPLGDKAETRAIKNVFEDHAYKLSVSSTKSQLGHSLGASGGIEIVLTIQAIRNNLVPPTINLETPDPNCDLDYTPNQSKEREINIAMSNSFGFGGHNACLIAKKWTA
jgi:3-oxoacyl-[acyl-carrier-protein] synthase II